MTGIIYYYLETARHQKHTCQTAGGRKEHQASVRRSVNHWAPLPSFGSEPVGRHNAEGIQVKFLFLGTWRKKKEHGFIIKLSIQERHKNNSTWYMHSPLSSFPPLTLNNKKYIYAFLV